MKLRRPRTKERQVAYEVNAAKRVKGDKLVERLSKMTWKQKIKWADRMLKKEFLHE